MRLIDSDKIKQDTVDARLVIHARWIGEEFFDGDGINSHVSKECSNCHKIRAIDYFCSNCGAKMDM